MVVHCVITYMQVVRRFSQSCITHSSKLGGSEIRKALLLLHIIKNLEIHVEEDNCCLFWPVYRAYSLVVLQFFLHYLDRIILSVALYRIAKVRNTTALHCKNVPKLRESTVVQCHWTAIAQLSLVGQASSCTRCRVASRSMPICISLTLRSLRQPT